MRLTSLYSHVFNFATIGATVLLLASPRQARALPAFAIRENMSCVVCHASGSAPHLTKMGYLYRRAGFRMPVNIGNKELDDKAMNLTDHFAVGAAVDYQVVSNIAPGETASTLTANHFFVREAELWPLVGAFLGNYATWMEIDGSPQVTAERGAPATPGTTTSSGAVTLSQADLRYVVGNADAFLNFRVGLMAMEGVGASDQWIDDANIPLIDQLTPQYNQDTLALPLGAMEVPRFGIEVGLNYQDAHLTLGMYNPFDGTNGLSGKTQSTLTAGLMNPEENGARDYKVQLDQFLGEKVTLTASYYNGRISLLDPSNTLVWVNHYDTWRLYAAYDPFGRELEFLGGAAYGTNEYVNPGSSIVAGQFHDNGAFLGASYYGIPHLTLQARYDYFNYNTGTNTPAKANGLALMAGFPHENSLFVFHYNNLWSDLAGVNHDFRAEWRFLL